MLESSVLERRRWSRVLREAGHHVLEARDVGAATDLIVRQSVELIVSGGRQAETMLSEMSWVAPWLPLICLAGPEGVSPGMEKAAIVLESPVTAPELAAWVDTELLLQRTMA